MNLYARRPALNELSKREEALQSVFVFEIIYMEFVCCSTGFSIILN